MRDLVLTETGRTILHPCITPNPSGAGCSGQEGTEDLLLPPLPWLGKLFHLGYFFFQFLAHFFWNLNQIFQGNEARDGWKDRELHTITQQFFGFDLHQTLS